VRAEWEGADEKDLETNRVWKNAGNQWSENEVVQENR
jgi:hypothetical protein